MQDITKEQLSIFPTLDSVTCPNVSTEAAAFYLNRRPQTLRKWACLEDGPIRPIRINGRLAWRVSDLHALLNGGI
ncbi:MAG: DNA-binding protein [Nitrosomonadaceae bacterium]|nr:DNA-binding protein [Nitrosomonadaceae bacterium]